jgi:hypothetical protein
MTTCKRGAVFFGLTLCFAGYSHALSAQASCNVVLTGSCTTSAVVSLPVGTVVSMDQPSSTTVLGAPTAANYATGYGATTGPTLTVKANSGWTLRARAATSVWSATNSSPGVSAWASKPASDLTWSLSSGGTFTALSTTSVPVATGSATAGTNETIYLRTLYSWMQDTPGAYSLGVIFSFSSP